MEPATHDDIRGNYLDFRWELRDRVSAFLVPDRDRHNHLVLSLAHATPTCRVHYMRVRDPLPAPGDIPAMAAYWKQHYNTPLGKGTPAEFIAKFEDHVIRTGAGVPVRRRYLVDGGQLADREGVGTIRHGNKDEARRAARQRPPDWRGA